MILVLLFGCAGEPEESAICAEFPESASEPPSVLENADSCGYWTVPEGDQLVVSVVVTEPESPCEMSADEGLTLLYDPIYTNLSNDAPKWTFQIGGASEVSAAYLEITCDEGTAWAAHVDVTPAE